MIIFYENMKIFCANCKHYESYHHYPNPNAVARHYCTKCKDEIKMVRNSMFTNLLSPYIPKECYFNNYFEESDEYKKYLDKLYKSDAYDLACQVED